MAVEDSALHWVEPALPKQFLRLLFCRILNKLDARALDEVVEMIPPSSSLMHPTFVYTQGLLADIASIKNRGCIYRLEVIIVKMLAVACYD
jgi:hypothetical protein